MVGSSVPYPGIQPRPAGVSACIEGLFSVSSFSLSRIAYYFYLRGQPRILSNVMRHEAGR
eukprot:scaffold132387_cov69-Phaeocystis_antarctica.AAC.2